ncbi:DUF6524 family protein [Mangrovicoccus algicola]|uniref:Uncharacterized protein n=1 Tax=Mangrovicoccus algicola TaxID=2771008 RepID=A0A8J6YZE0_9RHOB|nr:DUF6524 family protein [Mangrovicoccus algicola]MBE3640465.1 hypothetical protein [Mangrovicoccus algicola]
MSEILPRWAIAFLLVSATFNPTQVNYIRWALDRGWSGLSLTVLLGLVLFALWLIFLRATLRSIGPFGMALVAAIFAASVWVLRDLGILTLRNNAVTTWLGILGLSLVLGIGLGWSHVRRRLSGQADMDDVDED